MVELIKMSQEDYEDYIRNAIVSYEEELLLSGRFKTEHEAHEFAVSEYNDIFKFGLSTPDIYLNNIIVDEHKVRILWFLNEDKQGFPGEAFIGDFLIYENYRRKGYGNQALYLVEEYVKELGLLEIRLGVMKHNIKAKKLYERMDYTIFKQREHDCIMQKRL